MDLQLELLGLPKVNFKDKVTTLSLNKPSLLLLFLAARNDWVSRTELAYLFRPDEPEKKALTHLRTLIHRAKKYPWASKLESNKTHLRWQVKTDLNDFLTAFQNKEWKLALRHYKGSFLSGYSAADLAAYSAWLELERSDLKQKWQTASRKQIEALNAKGDLANALKLILPLRQDDSFDEELFQIHLRLLLQDNREQEAKHLYKAFCEQLKTEFDAAPLESTQALIDSFESRTAQTIQKAKKQNLPMQTTRFIGRAEELTHLRNKLQQADCRLLTIVGLGGTGKTRLSLEFAKSQKEHFRDGVYFVPLAPVVTEDALLSALAETIDFVFSGSDTLRDQLFAFLEQKELLLVLDNFEQLKSQALLLEELLVACPKLKLLVTSRVALELQSEYLFDVYGLSYPNSTDSPELFDAVKLFLNRAERVSASFIRSKETLESISDIVRFVEGLPLAVELAATWARSLSCSEINQNLRKNVTLLSSKVQNLPTRQQSMVTVFDTSFEQLSLLEQKIIIELAIFEGSFDLQAAQKIADAHLVLLLNLINRSLIRRTSAGRYSIHELLRQYLSAKQTIEAQRELNDRYSKYYLQTITSNMRAMHGAKPQAVLMQLSQDLDNIRKAYKLAALNHDWSSLLQAHTGLRALMSRTGRWQELAAMYEQLKQVLRHIEPSQQSSKLNTVTELSSKFTSWFLKQNTYEIDKAYYLQVLEQEQAIDMQIELLFHLAHYDENQGRFAEAEKEYLTSLEKAKELNDTIWQGAILERLTDNPWLRGDYAQAAHYAREWLELSERTQETTFIVQASLILHNRLTMMGNSEAKSDALLQKAFQYKDEVSLKSQALIYQGFGLHNYYQKDYQASVKNLVKSLDLFLQTSDKRTSALVAISLGRALKEELRFAEAHEAIRKSIELFVFTTLQYSHLAEIERHRGNIPLAKSYLIEALDAYIGNPQPLFILLEAFICLALIYQETNKQQDALELARYVYHHNSATVPQKTRLQDLFQPLEASSKFKNKPLEEVLKLQIKQLKNT